MHSAEPSQELRDAYFVYNKDVRLLNSKVGCMLVVVLMPAGLSLDYFVYPQALGLFFLLRLICSVLAALVLGLLLKTKFGSNHYRTLGMMWFVLPSLFISMMIYYEDGVNSSYYAGLNLVMIAVSWVAQVDFVETIIAFVLTLVMYCTACFAHGPVTGSVLFNNLYFIVLTGIIVVTGSYFVNRLRFREFAARVEVDRSRKELEASNLKLIELDRAKSNFFANLSHELRTPLTLLVAPLEKMLSAPVQASATSERELLEIMYGNAMRLLRLINDLLNLVRLDSKTLTLRKKKVQLKAFLQGLAQSVEPMAQKSGLAFARNVNIAEDAEGYIDRDKAEKILLNLLFNAFKFTPKGGRVELTASLSSAGLEILVKDTGVGISAADLQRVFDRFWQAEGSATRHYQGAGIGLALVRELAVLHGGTITAESEVDKGTCMTVILDVAAPASKELAQDEVSTGTPNNEDQAEWLARLYHRAEFFPAHVLAGSVSVTSNGQHRPAAAQILLVDDEPDMRRFLSSQLKEHYNVQEARNGAEALELAKNHEFNLVLLDYMMPEMDGAEVMRCLREIPTAKTVPIIILTARTDEDFKLKILEAGATDFLTKPFSSTELMVRTENVISTNRLQRRLMEQTRELEAALEQIKESEALMVHQAKMASLGQLSAGLMHEINNPLNFANTAVHLLKKRLNNHGAEGPSEQLTKPLTDIQEGVQRVIGIVSSLRDFTHPDYTTFEKVSLSEAIQTAVRFVQYDSKAIALQIEIPTSLCAWANRNQLTHLFINLLQNSIDSLKEKGASGGRIQIDAAEQSGSIRIDFYDNGKGIAAENLPKVFDAFFTTKKVGAGMGLGLNICHRIVEQHKGTLRVESQKDEFCRFTLTFPISKAV